MVIHPLGPKSSTMVSVALRASVTSRGRLRAAGFPTLRLSRLGSAIRVGSAAVRDSAMSRRASERSVRPGVRSRAMPNGSAIQRTLFSG
jgi:hypothetical protein